jgi:glycosyltransferase 2 family protein
LAVIGALVLLVRNRAEPEQLARVVEHARPAWLLLAVVLQLATYPCTALVWTYVIRKAGARPPPLGKLLRLSVAELFTDQTIPSGGMSGTVLVVSSLKKRGVPQRAAVGAVVASLAGYYIAQIIGVGVAFVVLLVAGRFGGWEVTASTIAIVGALAMPIPLVAALVGALNKLPKRVQRIRAVSELCQAVNDAPRDLVFTPSVLAVSTALRFAVLVLDGATLAISLVAIGSPMPLAQATAVYALAYVVGSVTFLPGGLGTFEVASTTLLAGIGAPFSAAGAATLLMRGLSFWIPMIPGVWFARREVTREPAAV